MASWCLCLVSWGPLAEVQNSLTNCHHHKQYHTVFTACFYSEAKFYPAWFYTETIIRSSMPLLLQGMELLKVTEWGGISLQAAMHWTCCSATGVRGHRRRVENYLPSHLDFIRVVPPSSLHCRSFLWTRIPAACSWFDLLSLLQFLLSLNLIEPSCKQHGIQGLEDIILWATLWKIKRVDLAISLLTLHPPAPNMQ